MLKPSPFLALLVFTISMRCGSALADRACPEGPAPQARAVVAVVAPAPADPVAYRLAAARHIYEAYPGCVLHGKLPRVISAAVLVNLAVDKDGSVRHIRFLRVPPEMPTASTTIRRMIDRISPFPTSSAVGTELIAFNEVWVFDEEGRFQLGALTEGPME